MFFIFISCAFVSQEDLQDRLTALDTESSPSQPGVSEPDVSEPDVSEPDVSEPETSEPESQMDTAVEDPCAQVIIVEYPIEILPNEGCLWGEFGNGFPEQGHIQARMEHTASFFPEEGQYICDVYFDFESQDGGKYFSFGFDDHLLILLNQHIVFASHKEFVEYFVEQNNSYLYDWNALFGTQMKYDTDYWLLGEESLAFFAEPREQAVGDGFLEIDSTAFEPLRAQIIEDNRINLQLVTIGDNDETDCYNHAFFTTFYIKVSEI